MVCWSLLGTWYHHPASGDIYRHRHRFNAGISNDRAEGECSRRPATRLRPSPRRSSRRGRGRCARRRHRRVGADVNRESDRLAVRIRDAALPRRLPVPRADGPSQTEQPPSGKHHERTEHQRGNALQAPKRHGQTRCHVAPGSRREGQRNVRLFVANANRLASSSGRARRGAEGGRTKGHVAGSTGEGATRQVTRTSAARDHAKASSVSARGEGGEDDARGSAESASPVTSTSVPPHGMVRAYPRIREE